MRANAEESVVGFQEAAMGQHRRQAETPNPKGPGYVQQGGGRNGQAPEEGGTRREDAKPTEAREALQPGEEAGCEGGGPVMSRPGPQARAAHGPG